MVSNDNDNGQPQEPNMTMA